jgi:uncharacterized protein with von Willebrand factor type A (vWA) domain
MTNANEFKAYMLLDRSGSMQTNWNETVGAVNAYVSELSKTDAGRDTEVTLAVFDSGNDFEVIRANARPMTWSAFRADEAAPRGSTPLYDAIGKLVTKVRADSPVKATIVIITDGAENCSQEVKKDAAKAMLDDMRAKNFDVVFIGANFDAFAQGSSLGNNAGQTLNMTPGNYDAAMLGLSARTSAYNASGSVGDFSDDLRRRSAAKR